MKLIIHELTDTGLEQVIVPEKNTIVEAIRPHIYRHNFADGNLKLIIQNADAELVAESDPVNIADIGSMNYFHGHVRFDIDAYLEGGEEYTVILVGENGYDFNESAYVGWVNGHDLATYPINGTPNSHYNYPLDLQVWERTAK